MSNYSFELWIRIREENASGKKSYFFNLLLIYCMWLLAHDTKHIVSVLTENVLLMILPDHIYRLIILLGKKLQNTQYVLIQHEGIFSDS